MGASLFFYDFLYLSSKMAKQTIVIGSPMELSLRGVKWQFFVTLWLTNMNVNILI